jgi:hypothetical protein
MTSAPSVFARDVMEPLAYHVSLAYSLLAYFYFLYTRSYFEQKDFKEYCE